MSAPPMCWPTSLCGLVLAVAPLSARDKAGAPVRAPLSSRNVLTVPYPMADAERVEGIGRAALARAQFVFVDVPNADPAQQITAPRNLDAKRPTLIAGHLDPTSAGYGELRRLPFEGPGSVQPLEASPEELAQWGVAAPGAAVWLVGPDGSCRGKVASPIVQLDPRDRQLVTVAYPLDGCRGAQWAPVGIVANAIPIDFRWKPATTVAEQTLDHGRSWEHPLASLVSWPRWEHDDAPLADLVRAREIPDVTPQVVQLQIATVSAVPNALNDGTGWCASPVAWSIADGWYNGRWLDPIPWHREAIAPYILGAFVNDAQVDAVIYDDRLDGLVVVPPGPLDDMDDPTAWTQVFVPTWVHDDTSIRGWAGQGIDGGLPPGPACIED